MRHLIPLAIKATAISLFAVIVLPSTGIMVWQAVVMGLATSALLYITGDMIILDRWGNLAATFADAALAFAFLYYLWPWDIARSLLALVVLSGAIGAFEWYFHSYLGNANVAGLPLLPGDNIGDRHDAENHKHLNRRRTKRSH